MKSLLVIGAGGHGLVVADAALSMSKWQRICFLDNRAADLGQPLGLEVVGTCEELESCVARFDAAVVAIGNVHTRLDYIRQCSLLGIDLPTIVHPAATVSRFASLGDGTVVFAQAAINPGAVLARGCIVNTGATVDHGCQLDEGVHISPGAHLGGDVQVGARTWVGIGASVRQGIRIGADVMVGAGAAVVADVSEGIVVGVPAKVKHSR